MPPSSIDAFRNESIHDMPAKPRYPAMPAMSDTPISARATSTCRATRTANCGAGSSFSEWCSYISHPGMNPRPYPFSSTTANTAP